MMPARLSAVFALLAIVATTTGSLVACGGDELPSSFGADGKNKNEDDDTSGGFGQSDAGSGTPGESSCAATVAQTAKGKVDIIFVIDGSGSMGEEMTQVRTNVNTFAAKIGGSGLDYTVTFLTRKATSPSQGGNVICVPAPLAGANCADRPPVFFHVDQNVSSNNSLDLILSTMSRWSANLRPEATKVFVEVTDDESDLAAAAFDTQLLARPGFGTSAARNYVFHSIISKPSGATAPTSQKCSSADGTSLVYQQLSTLTGGLMDEVCKTDYSGVLDNIAKGIVDKVGCELAYPAKEAADPTQLVVQVTPPGGTAKGLTQVTDASKCSTVADAWYYDNPQKPTKILLCPTTCTSANAASGSKVEALVGCKAPAPK